VPEREPRGRSARPGAGQGRDAIRHHDLCFGCGQANPFGLQLELEPDGRGSLDGRFFVKQDHQGPPDQGA
jgi:hypothetical protein